MSKVTAACRMDPVFSIAMNDTEIGVAISANVPININEDVDYPNVVDVKTFRGGVIDIEAAEGFHIISGEWIMHPTNHYSGQGAPFGHILNQIKYYFSVTGKTTAAFTIIAGELSTAPGNPPINQINGSVNATLKVVYAAD